MRNKYKGLDVSLIEAKVPEEISVRAEELIDEKTVSGLQKKNQFAWQSIVIDNNLHYSVELNIKDERLTGCKCNCKIYRKEKICAHILASIFQVRKTSERDVRKKKKSEKTGQKSFNLSDLLSKLSREEIDSFIISKARSDRNFKLLLQGRFIEKLSPDQLSPYIESTFPVLTKANEKIAASKLKIFLDIAEELQNHFKNLISQDDLKEAYHLAFLLLKKSFYIKFHLHTEHFRFYKLHKNLLSNYVEVYKLIEAPEYKEDINNQLEELLITSYISASLKEEKDLWMLLYAIKERREKLNQIIQSFLQRGKTSDYNSYYFIKMLEFILIENHNKQIQLIDQKDMQECYRIIQYFKNYNSYQACQSGMYMFYLHKMLNHPLAKTILQNLEQKYLQTEKTLERTITYYLKYKDNIYLSFLKDISPNWSKTNKAVIVAIKEMANTQLLIRFYLETHKTRKALKELRENLSWDLLKKFDRELTEEAEQECRDLYYTTLENYLENHFGINAQEFTKEVFNRAISLGFKIWIPELKSRLSLKFPERKIIYR